MSMVCILLTLAQWLGCDLDTWSVEQHFLYKHKCKSSPKQLSGVPRRKTEAVFNGYLCDTQYVQAVLDR